MVTKRSAASISGVGFREPFADLLELRNNFLLNLAFLLASVLLLAPSLGPVPSSNENAYLLLMKQQWDPTLLARDWTFAAPVYSHLIFSFLFGALTVPFS